MATVITLLLVPVFYSIAVLDLTVIKWAPGRPSGSGVAARGGGDVA
jgi:hypothetical protein